MASVGYIQVHTFASNARIPLSGVAISITAPDGTLIATRLSDRSGLITPVELPVPPISAGQTPNTGEIPFATVTIHAQIPGYDQITANEVQVFPDTVTNQDLEMIPQSELPEAWDKAEYFDTPPQNL